MSDAIVVFLIIAAFYSMVKKKAKKKMSRDGQKAAPPRQQPVHADQLRMEDILPKTDEAPAEKHDCGLPHGSIADEVHEGLDPCHDGQEPVPAPVPRLAAQPARGLNLSDTARGIVMAEILGKPGGRWAGGRN